MSSDSESGSEAAPRSYIGVVTIHTPTTTGDLGPVATTIQVVGQRDVAFLPPQLCSVTTDAEGRSTKTVLRNLYPNVQQRLCWASPEDDTERLGDGSSIWSPQTPLKLPLTASVAWEETDGTTKTVRASGRAGSHLMIEPGCVTRTTYTPGTRMLGCETDFWTADPESTVICKQKPEFGDDPSSHYNPLRLPLGSQRRYDGTQFGQRELATDTRVGEPTSRRQLQV